MGRKQSQRATFKPGDHDVPTEPVVERIVLPPPVEPVYPREGRYPDALAVPVPQAGTRPFPQEHAPGGPPYPLAAYPILPEAPLKKYRGHPPGGSPPIYQPERSLKRRRSLVPGLVRLCLILIQWVLLARVVCMLFSIVATNIWLNLLFLASDLFVLPLSLLAADLNVGPLAGTQLLIYLEYLLAVLAYGLFSRLFVGFLKALLSHS